MTVSTTTRKQNYASDGATVDFPFAFKVFQDSDVVVLLTDSTGVVTTLTEGVDFTVALNSDQNNNPGGTASLTGAAPAAGITITVTSAVPNTQTTDITNQGGFYPNTIEDMADRVTIVVQQQQVDVDRSIKFPLADADVGTDLPPVASRINKALIFDGTGAPTVSTDNYVDQATNAAASAAAALASENNAAASEAAAAADAASALASLDAFEGQYYGALAADPALDPLGNAVDAGDAYWNTTDNLLRVYDGAAWQNAYAFSAALVTFMQAASLLEARQDLGVLSNAPILSTGGTNAYVVAAGLTAYVDDVLYPFLPASNNTGACTVDHGPGAVSIKLKNGNDPASGDLAALVPAMLKYDGVNMVLQNPQTPVSRGVAQLSGGNDLVGPQRGEEYDLGTLSGTFNPDFNLDNDFTVTLNGNATLGTPANQVPGQSGYITINQDATGGWSLAFSADWLWGSVGAPSLNTTASTFNVIHYKVNAVGKIVASAWVHS